MNIRVLLALLAGAALVAASHPEIRDAGLPPPATLAETGLFEAGSHQDIRAGNVAFAPQHPLWTDGMDKRRWLYLPPGTSIDKSNPDAWEFPVGTKAWKEFSANGRVETRLIERAADGTWRYATYIWNAAGTEATLAPDDGVPARGIPSRTDCLACHEGAAVPILGYSAVQLNPDVIAGPTPATRAVLGYLHGNCAHCHNDSALPALELPLAQSAANPHASAKRSLAALVGRESRFRPHGAVAAQRVVPGRAEDSILVARLKSPDPLTRMPPIGVQIADARALAAIERWINNEARQPREIPQ